MTDWIAVPTFGSSDTTLPRVVRPSAYVVVGDASGRLAIVHAAGGVYLPGGGIEEGESPERAARREAREECGVAIELGGWRRAAIEYVTALAEGTHFEKRSTFLDATVVVAISTASEPGHEVAWLAPREALTALTPLSHRWAVAEWIAQVTAPQISRPAV
jgi:8-oxo-dGTP diphosphatase